MSCKRPFVIALFCEREQALIENTAKYTHHCKVVRSKIVLPAASGLDNRHRSQLLEVPRRIVTKWRKRLYLEGLQSLEDRLRCGRPLCFSSWEHCGNQSAGHGLSSLGGLRRQAWRRSATVFTKWRAKEFSTCEASSPIFMTIFTR